METILYVPSGGVRQPVGRARDTRAAVQQSSRSDVVFLDEGGITVTNTRFVSGGETFALAGVTSVRGVEIPPNRTGPYVLVLVAIILFLVFLGNELLVGGFVTSVPILVAAVFWFLAKKPTFAVVLKTAGGEVTAYVSADRGFIARVIDALTHAIIERG